MKDARIQDEHKLKLIFSNGAGCKDLLILAHIDIDGAMSAYAFATALRNKYRNIYVVFTKPNASIQLRKYLITKYKRLRGCETAYIDLCPNQMYPGMTAHLLEYLVNHMNLTYIIDHHMGWPEFLKYNNVTQFSLIQDYKVVNQGKESKYIILGRTPSCTELIFDYFNLDKTDEHLQDVYNIARISDDLNIRSEFEGTEAYRKFSGLKGEDVYDIIDRLVNKDLNTDNTWYDQKTTEVKEYMSRAKEVYPGIGYIQLLSNSKVNRTLLCEQGYKRFKVFIISEVNSHKLKITYTIATALDSANLIDMFKLRSGCPKKISVCKKHVNVDYIVDKFKPYLDV